MLSTTFKEKYEYILDPNNTIETIYTRLNEYSYLSYDDDWELLAIEAIVFNVVGVLRMYKYQRIREMPENLLYKISAVIVGWEKLEVDGKFYLYPAIQRTWTHCTCKEVE